MTLRIISPTVPRLIDGDANYALLVSCTQKQDSSDLVTRVYPYGGGIGDGKLTLQYATKAAGAYASILAISIDPAANFVKLSSESSNRVDRSVGFKDIQPETPDARERERAANALLDAAVVWLYQHSTAITTYELTVANVAKGSLNPGDTVHVEYAEYVAGQEVWAIDHDLIVMEIQYELGTGATGLTRLTVSTVAAWPVSDKELLAREIRNSRALSSRPQAVGLGNVQTTDFATSTMGMVTGNGGLAYGGVDAASGAGGIVVSGMAAHELVGPYHFDTGLSFGPPAQVIKASTATSFVWSIIADADLPSTIVRTSRTVTGTGWLGGGGALSSNRTLTLNTPAAVSASSLNSDATNHTHTVDAVDTSIAAVDLMRTNAAGGFTFADGSTIRSTTMTEGGPGYYIEGSGKAYFQTLLANEMHAKSFIADLEQALAGGQVITKSVAPLAADFTLPAAGDAGGAPFAVQAFQGFENFRVFVDGDLVRFRNFSRSGSSLTISDAWGTAWWASTDTTNKTQTYTFVRSATAGGLSGFADPELMTNGGFETLGGGGADVFGAPWTENAGSGAIAAETTILHGGAYSCKLTNGVSDDTYAYNTTAVTAERHYRYTFWTRGDGTNAGWYGVYDVSHSSWLVAISTTGVTGTTWTQVVYDFWSPVGCTSVRLYCHSGTSATGAIAYYDDASLIQVGAGGLVIPKGALVLDYGASGNGYIESVAQSGAMALGVPYLTMKTWNVHPQSTAAGEGLTERVHIGNMRQTYGVGANDYYGIGLGDYASGDYLKYDSNGGLEMAIGGGKFRYTASGEAIYESGNTYLFQWYDASARYIADDYVLEATDTYDERIERLFLNSYYTSGIFDWVVLSGTPGTPGTARAEMYLRGSAASPVFIVYMGATEALNVSAAGLFVPDGNKIGLEGAAGDTYIKRNGAAIEFWVDGALCGHVNAATGFVND